MTGQTLSHFEISEKLGEGGMGIVYKARDTQLNRPVAIKVLHPGKVADPERRRRFIQEARAASALNHPNIVTIYEIGQANGVDFMAMEFIPGRTLDQAIPRKGMRLNEALKYAIQISSALAKAHAAGITHRDLKPSNIMVTDEGLVKVLDFGLAKLTEPVQGTSESAATLTAQSGNEPHTKEGTVVGTVAYMSPEQAEGRIVDARSDIFSFGSVLYEMVTGHRAFQGETGMATLANVIKQDPKPIGDLAPAVPRELEKLIGRCLRKDADRRAQHIADIKLGLEEIREDSESVSASGLTIAPSGPSRPSWLIPAVVGGVLAVGAGAFVLRDRQSAQPAAMGKPVVLTSYAGLEDYPALSPDGKHIAFTWNGEKEDNSDIYVKLVDAGNPIRLTQDPDSDEVPAWSPDGNFIAFLRHTREATGGYYVIPALGGQERKIADLPATPSHRPHPTVDWSPDGKALVIVDTSVDPPALASVSIATGEKKRLTSPPPKSFGDAAPHVSPDGRWLAFSRAENVAAGDWFVVRFGTDTPSEPKRLTDFHSDIRCGAAWTAASDAILACGAVDGERRIWRVATSGSKPQPIPELGDGDERPTVSRAANRLAFRRAYSDSNLWRAVLEDPATEPVRVIASSRDEQQPDYSPDGSRIAFVSTRTGRMEIWVASTDGSNPVQLTNQGAAPTAPRWSPDGKRIAFAKRPGGNTDVYVADAQGGAPKRLTTDPANDASAYWSRDGKWVYFASNRSGQMDVWKTPSDGSGPDVQVTKRGGWRSSESVDGKTLYYQKFDQPHLWRMPVDGGEETKVADLPPLVTWYSVGDTSYWISFRSGPELRRIDHATGRQTVARRLPRETSGGTSNFTVSPSGSDIVFVRVDQRVSDLMLVENFR